MAMPPCSRGSIRTSTSERISRPQCPATPACLVAVSATRFMNVLDQRTLSRACTHSDCGVCALTKLRFLKTNALVFYALLRQIKFLSRQHSLQPCNMHDGPLGGY